MTDLAEHIGTVIWIAGGLLFICGILIGLVWNDNKKNIAEAKRIGGEFAAWLKKIGLEEGGIVTRKQYYDWCSVQQQKCPAAGGFGALTEWRNGMLEKGGVLTRAEHTFLDDRSLAICKEMVKELGNHFSEKMETCFEHHREWVGQELRLLSSQTDGVLKLLKQQMETENGRWADHDEMRKEKG